LTIQKKHFSKNVTIFFVETRNGQNKIHLKYTKSPEPPPKGLKHGGNLVDHLTVLGIELLEAITDPEVEKIIRIFLEKRKVVFKTD
jgi:hypothetical protein